MNADRIALMNIQYKYFPLTRFLDDAVKYGIPNIELWGATPFAFYDDMTCSDIKKLKNEIDSRGLNLVCYTPEQCVYPVNIASDSEAERRRSMQFFENSIRLGSELGTDKMLITSGWGYFDNSNKGEAWKRSVESIASLSEMGKKYGIKLMMEVLRKDESNLVNDLDSLMKILKEVDNDNLYAMIDNVPMVLDDKSPKDYLELLGDRLQHVHFIDGLPAGHLAWGDGVFPMEQFLKEFDDYGYKGCYSLEITSNQYFLEPWKSVEKSIERMLKY